LDCSRSVVDAQGFERAANDPQLKAIAQAVGHPDIIIREGNVVVQYYATARPNRLPKVRRALKNLAG